MPTRVLSRLGRCASWPSRLAVRRFAHSAGIDVSEAELELSEYTSVQALFTRRLKPGLRPIASAPFVSPVDGQVSQVGLIADGILPQAKGRSYSVEALLADSEAGMKYRRGSFATLYLSPRDYHRVHSPVRGAITRWAHIPGQLNPVNPKFAQHLDQLFAINERLITFISTEGFGTVAVVMVGATMVGNIRVHYDRDLRTNLSGPPEVRKGVLEVPVMINKGDEMGVFELGSTVIVLSETALNFALRENEFVRVGQSLLNPRDRLG